MMVVFRYSPLLGKCIVVFLFIDFVSVIVKFYEVENQRVSVKYINMNQSNVSIMNCIKFYK